MAITTRREFIKVAGMGSIALAGGSLLSCRKTTAQMPNIVLILADDLGYGDLSCLNPDSKITTTHLDTMAARGMTFTDAHSGSAVCTPTRYGILTGRYCWRSELKQAVLWAWDGPLIEPDRLTVGDFLKHHGYNTACIGKWHLGWDWPTKDGTKMNDFVRLGEWNAEKRDAFGDNIDFSKRIKNGPVTRGFDYYFGDDVPNFAPYCFIENDKSMGVPTDQKPPEMFGTPGPMRPGWDLEAVMPALTERAVNYIKAGPGEEPFNKKAENPFFLYFPLTAPHTPIAPDDAFKGKSEAGAYGDFVQQVDWTVGKIMEALEESGQAENTLVIFTSDNGSPGRDGTNMSGPVSSVEKYGHDPSYIYRGTKADIWEGGHRIPFIAKWPGKIAEGSKSDEIICLTDFMATCAAMLNSPLPEEAAEDSYNLLPVLCGKNGDEPVRESVIHHSIHGMFSIRKGPWKLIDGQGSGGWSRIGIDDPAPGQLYHIVDDPDESDNLYEQLPEVVRELKTLLEQIKKEDKSI